MGVERYSRIVATGSHAGELVIPNSYFAGKKLYKENGSGRLEAKEKTEQEIYAVTGINSRRWTEHSPQHLGAQALEKILNEAKREPELLIVAHNSKFSNGIYSPIPALSAVAQKKTGNPNTIAFDAFTDDYSVSLDELAQMYAINGCSRMYTAEADEFGIKEEKFYSSGGRNDPEVIIVEHAGWCSMAKRIKDRLGLSRTATLDIIAGCPGFTVALDVADKMIKYRNYHSVAVVGLDKLSAISDLCHLDSTLFADAAAGYLLEASDEPGIIYSRFETYGSEGDALRLDIGAQERLASEGRGTGQFEAGRKYLRMDGRRIFEFAVRQLPLFVSKLLDGAKLNLSDISLLCLHQMNLRIMQATTERVYHTQNDSELEQIMKKIVPVSLHNHGNSSVATIGLTFDLCRRGEIAGFEVKLGSGKYVMNVAVGAGLVLGGNVIKL